MEYGAICESLQGIIRVCGSLRLANCIGTERAAALEAQARQVLELLADEVTLLQAMALTCQVALDCIGLTKAVDLELASQMMDCFDEELALTVWGFSVELAQVIALSLAAVAGLLDLGHHDMNIPSHRYAKRSMIAPYLEPVAADFDVIAPQVYAALCRFELENSTREERNLVHAFQQICIWILTILYRFEGSGIEAANFWDWSGGDPHWAMVLGKGVLAFQQAPSTSSDESPSLPVPEELSQLQTAVLSAICQLHLPQIAFGGELEAGVIADDLGGGFSLGERLVGSDLHRSRLAQAASDANLIAAAVNHLSSTQEAHCVSSLASFLVALMQPLQSSTSAWKEVIDGDHQETSISSKLDAEGVLDAFIEETSMHRHSLWALFFATPERPGRGLLQELAQLAGHVTPPAELCCIALPRWVDEAYSDITCLASITLLAANSGFAPGHHAIRRLTERLGSCSQAQREELTTRLARQKGKRRYPETWEAWYNFIGSAPLVERDEVVESEVEAVPPPAPPPPAEAVTSEPKKKVQTSLRDIIREAPRDLCCSLDGKLLMDPVRSPYGHVFERSNLAKALEKRCGHCPLTFEPLSLSDCTRDAELRLRATRWVRLAVPPK